MLCPVTLTISLISVECEIMLSSLSEPYLFLDMYVDFIGFVGLCLDMP
jgi:hypothetical protein